MYLTALCVTVCRCFCARKSSRRAWNKFNLFDAHPSVLILTYPEKSPNRSNRFINSDYYNQYYCTWVLVPSTVREKHSRENQKESQRMRANNTIARASSSPLEDIAFRFAMRWACERLRCSIACLGVNGSCEKEKKLISSRCLKLLVHSASLDWHELGQGRGESV